MGVISGKLGNLEGVNTYRNANITDVSNLKELRHAGTQGGIQRLIGVKDWNGTWDEFGMVPTWFPGEEVTYQQSIDGTSTAGKIVKGTALVTQVVITIPVGGQEPPTITGTFRGVTAISYSATDAMTTPTAQIIPPAKGICVQLADQTPDSPSFVAEANTNNIVITLSIEAKEFNDCSTLGIMDALDGGFDANVTYTRYIDDWSLLPSKDTPYSCKIGLDSVDTTFYLFDYMLVGDVTNIGVNPETGDIVEVTIPLLHSQIETIGTTTPTATKGSIKKPDTTTWRPA
jgi:hypothetical protein